MLASTTGQVYHQRNQDATIWVGNLDQQVTEELLFELFVQAAPLVNVQMPKDKITNVHQGYGFVEFENPLDADYAIKIMNMLKLYGKPLRCNMAAKDTKQEEFFAKLYIGGLDQEIDEKFLFDTFSRFGAVLSCKIMTEEDSPVSRGFGFITFDSFESADLAIATMNGQYFGGKAITVSYAFKKDGSKGERHGSAEERKLAAQALAASGTRQLRPQAESLAVMNMGARIGVGGARGVPSGAAPQSYMQPQQQRQGETPMMSPPPPPFPMMGLGRGMPSPPPPPFPGHPQHQQQQQQQQQRPPGMPNFPPPPQWPPHMMGLGRGMPMPPPPPPHLMMPGMPPMPPGHHFPPPPPNMMRPPNL